MDSDDDLGNHLKEYLTEQESTLQPSGTNASPAIHLENAQPEIKKSLIKSVWQERRESLDTDEDLENPSDSEHWKFPKENEVEILDEKEAEMTDNMCNVVNNEATNEGEDLLDMPPNDAIFPAIHLEDAQTEIEKSLVESVLQKRRESLDADEDLENPSNNEYRKFREENEAEILDEKRQIRLIMCLL